LTSWSFVVGVLIALAVVNWNDERLDRDTEADYLRRLVTDLRADTTVFTVVLKLADEKERALKQITPILLNTSKPMADTSAFLSAVITASSLGWQQPQVRRITFDDLLSTGNLRLIGNTELRTSISSYYYGSAHSYKRIESRRTPFPSETYALVPRTRDEEGDEFSFQRDVEGVYGAHIIKSIRSSDLSRHVIAELNLAQFIKLRHLELREAAVGLLNKLEEAGASFGD